jgi:hypothetical protein
VSSVACHEKYGGSLLERDRFRVKPLPQIFEMIRLHVYPIVLGGGKRLFPEGKRLDLTLVEASPLPTGVVFIRYRRTA